jgi:hypothetical protein
MTVMPEADSSWCLHSLFAAQIASPNAVKAILKISPKQMI